MHNRQVQAAVARLWDPAEVRVGRQFQGILKSVGRRGSADQLQPGWRSDFWVALCSADVHSASYGCKGGTRAVEVDTEGCARSKGQRRK